MGVVFFKFATVESLAGYQLLTIFKLEKLNRLSLNVHLMYFKRYIRTSTKMVQIRPWIRPHQHQTELLIGSQFL